MGWEYHNRQRDGHGRFAATKRYAQLHLWCNAWEKQLIRARAAARHMSLSEYMLDLVHQDHLTACGKNGYTSGENGGKGVDTPSPP